MGNTPSPDYHQTNAPNRCLIIYQELFELSDVNMASVDEQKKEAEANEQFLQALVTLPSHITPTERLYEVKSLVLDKILSLYVACGDPQLNPELFKKVFSKIIQEIVAVKEQRSFLSLHEKRKPLYKIRQEGPLKLLRVFLSYADEASLRPIISATKMSRVELECISQGGVNLVIKYLQIRSEDRDKHLENGKWLDLCLIGEVNQLKTLLQLYSQSIPANLVEAIYGIVNPLWLYAHRKPEFIYFLTYAHDHNTQALQAIFNRSSFHRDVNIGEKLLINAVSAGDKDFVQFMWRCLGKCDLGLVNLSTGVILGHSPSVDMFIFLSGLMGEKIQFKAMDTVDFWISVFSQEETFNMLVQSDLTRHRAFFSTLSIREHSLIIYTALSSTNGLHKVSLMLDRIYDDSLLIALLEKEEGALVHRAENELIKLLTHTCTTRGIRLKPALVRAWMEKNNEKWGSHPQIHHEILEHLQKLLPVEPEVVSIPEHLSVFASNHTAQPEQAQQVSGSALN